MNDNSIIPPGLGSFSLDLSALQNQNLSASEILRSLPPGVLENSEISEEELRNSLQILENFQPNNVQEEINVEANISLGENFENSGLKKASGKELGEKIAEWLEDEDFETFIQSTGISPDEKVLSELKKYLISLQNEQADIGALNDENIANILAGLDDNNDCQAFCGEYTLPSKTEDDNISEGLSLDKLDRSLKNQFLGKNNINHSISVTLKRNKTEVGSEDEKTEKISYEITFHDISKNVSTPDQIKGEDFEKNIGERFSPCAYVYKNLTEDQAKKILQAIRDLQKAKDNEEYKGRQLHLCNMVPIYQKKLEDEFSEIKKEILSKENSKSQVEDEPDVENKPNDDNFFQNEIDSIEGDLDKIEEEFDEVENFFDDTSTASTEFDGLITSFKESTCAQDIKDEFDKIAEKFNEIENAFTQADKLSKNSGFTPKGDLIRWYGLEDRITEHDLLKYLDGIELYLGNFQSENSPISEKIREKISEKINEVKKLRIEVDKSRQNVENKWGFKHKEYTYGDLKKFFLETRKNLCLNAIESYFAEIERELDAEENILHSKKDKIKSVFEKFKKSISPDKFPEELCETIKSSLQEPILKLYREKVQSGLKEVEKKLNSKDSKLYPQKSAINSLFKKVASELLKHKNIDEVKDSPDDPDSFYDDCQKIQLKLYCEKVRSYLKINAKDLGIKWTKLNSKKNDLESLLKKIESRLGREYLDIFDDDFQDLRLLFNKIARELYCKKIRSCFEKVEEKLYPEENELLVKRFKIQLALEGELGKAGTISEDYRKNFRSKLEGFEKAVYNLSIEKCLEEIKTAVANKDDKDKKFIGIHVEKDQFHGVNRDQKSNEIKFDSVFMRTQTHNNPALTSLNAMMRYIVLKETGTYDLPVSDSRYQQASWIFRAIDFYCRKKSLESVFEKLNIKELSDSMSCLTRAIKSVNIPGMKPTELEQLLTSQLSGNSVFPKIMRYLNRSFEMTSSYFNKYLLEEKDALTSTEQSEGADKILKIKNKETFEENLTKIGEDLATLRGDLLEVIKQYNLGTDTDSEINVDELKNFDALTESLPRPEEKELSAENKASRSIQSYPILKEFKTGLNEIEDILAENTNEATWNAIDKISEICKNCLEKVIFPIADRRYLGNRIRSLLLSDEFKVNISNILKEKKLKIADLEKIKTISEFFAELREINSQDISGNQDSYSVNEQNVALTLQAHALQIYRELVRRRNENLKKAHGNLDPKNLELNVDEIVIEVPKIKDTDHCYNKRAVARREELLEFSKGATKIGVKDVQPSESIKKIFETLFKPQEYNNLVEIRGDINKQKGEVERALDQNYKKLDENKEKQLEAEKKKLLLELSKTYPDFLENRRDEIGRKIVDAEFLMKTKRSDEAKLSNEVKSLRKKHRNKISTGESELSRKSRELEKLRNEIFSIKSFIDELEKRRNKIEKLIGLKNSTTLEEVEQEILALQEEQKGIMLNIEPLLRLEALQRCAYQEYYGSYEEYYDFNKNFQKDEDWEQDQIDTIQQMTLYRLRCEDRRSRERNISQVCDEVYSDFQKVVKNVGYNAQNLQILAGDLSEVLGGYDIWRSGLHLNSIGDPNLLAQINNAVPNFQSEFSNRMKIGNGSGSKDIFTDNFGQLTNKIVDTDLKELDKNWAENDISLLQTDNVKQYLNSLAELRNNGNKYAKIMAEITGFKPISESIFHKDFVDTSENERWLEDPSPWNVCGLGDSWILADICNDLQFMRSKLESISDLRSIRASQNFGEEFAPNSYEWGFVRNIRVPADRDSNFSNGEIFSEENIYRENLNSSDDHNKKIFKLKDGKGVSCLSSLLKSNVKQSENNFADRVSSVFAAINNDPQSFVNQLEAEVESNEPLEIERLLMGLLASEKSRKLISGQIKTVDDAEKLAEICMEFLNQTWFKSEATRPFDKDKNHEQILAYNKPRLRALLSCVNVVSEIFAMFGEVRNDSINEEEAQKIREVAQEKIDLILDSLNNDILFQNVEAKYSDEELRLIASTKLYLAFQQSELAGGLQKFSESLQKKSENDNSFVKWHANIIASLAECGSKNSNGLAFPKFLYGGNELRRFHSEYVSYFSKIADQGENFIKHVGSAAKQIIEHSRQSAIVFDKANPDIDNALKKRATIEYNDEALDVKWFADGKALYVPPGDADLNTEVSIVSSVICDIFSGKSDVVVTNNPGENRSLENLFEDEGNEDFCREICNYLGIKNDELVNIKKVDGQYEIQPYSGSFKNQTFHITLPSTFTRDDGMQLSMIENEKFHFLKNHFCFVKRLSEDEIYYEFVERKNVEKTAYSALSVNNEITFYRKPLSEDDIDTKTKIIANSTLDNDDTVIKFVNLRDIPIINNLIGDDEEDDFEAELYKEGGALVMEIPTFKLQGQPVKLRKVEDKWVLSSNPNLELISREEFEGVINKENSNNFGGISMKKGQLVQNPLGSDTSRYLVFKQKSAKNTDSSPKKFQFIVADEVSKIAEKSELITNALALGNTAGIESEIKVDEQSLSNLAGKSPFGLISIAEPTKLDFDKENLNVECRALNWSTDKLDNPGEFTIPETNFKAAAHSALVFAIRALREKNYAQAMVFINAMHDGLSLGDEEEDDKIRELFYTAITNYDQSPDAAALKTHILLKWLQCDPNSKIRSYFEKIYGDHKIFVDTAYENSSQMEEIFISICCKNFITCLQNEGYYPSLFNLSSAEKEEIAQRIYKLRKPYESEKTDSTESAGSAELRYDPIFFYALIMEVYRDVLQEGNNTFSIENFSSLKSFFKASNEKRIDQEIQKLDKNEDKLLLSLPSDILKLGKFNSLLGEKQKQNLERVNKTIIEISKIDEGESPSFLKILFLKENLLPLLRTIIKIALNMLLTAIVRCFREDSDLFSLSEDEKNFLESLGIKMMARRIYSQLSKYPELKNELKYSGSIRKIRRDLGKIREIVKEKPVEGTMPVNSSSTVAKDEISGNEKGAFNTLRECFSKIEVTFDGGKVENSTSLGTSDNSSDIGTKNAEGASLTSQELKKYENEMKEGQEKLLKDEKFAPSDDKLSNHEYVDDFIKNVTSALDDSENGFAKEITINGNEEKRPVTGLQAMQQSAHEELQKLYLKVFNSYITAGEIPGNNMMPIIVELMLNREKPPLISDEDAKKDNAPIELNLPARNMNVKMSRGDYNSFLKNARVYLLTQNMLTKNEFIRGQLKTLQKLNDKLQKESSEDIKTQLRAAFIAINKEIEEQKSFCANDSESENNYGAVANAVGGGITRDELMVYESLSGIRPRVSQAELLKNLFAGDVHAFQLVMGGGKTAVLISLLSFYISRRKDFSVPVILSHPSQFESITGNVASYQRDRFNQDSLVLDIDRSSLNDIKSLKKLYRDLQNAKEKKQVVIARTNLLNTLQLTFQGVCRQKNIDDPKIRQKLKLLEDILSFFKKETTGIFDEADMNLSILTETNFPIGTEESLPESQIWAGSEFFRHVADLNQRRNKDLFKLKNNTQSQQSEEEFKKDLKSLSDHIFAQKIKLGFGRDIGTTWQEFFEDRGISREDFQKILYDKIDKEKDPFENFRRNDLDDDTFDRGSEYEFNVLEQLATFRGIIQTLRSTRKKSANQSYGFTIDNGKPVFRPYIAVGQPSTNEFGNPYEKLTYYYMYAMHNEDVQEGQQEDTSLVFAKQNGSIKLINDFYKSLQPKIIKEKEAHVSGDSTLEKTFEKITGVTYDRFDEAVKELEKGRSKLYDELIHKIQEYLSDKPHNRLIIFEYAGEKFLKFHKSKSASGAIQAVDMVGDSIACSGTTWNSKTWSSHLIADGKLREDVGTEGQILTKQKQEFEAGRAYTLVPKNESVEGVLDVLSGNDSIQGNLKDFRALIDSGGIFKAYNGETVAKKMFDWVQDKSIDIEGVLFFRPYKGKPGGEFCIVNDSKVVPLQGTTQGDIRNAGFDPDKIAVYYDEAHTVGTDVKFRETAFAVQTFDPFHTTMRDLNQGSMRMRGLLSSQKVHIACPKSYLEQTKGNLEQTSENGDSNSFTFKDVLKWSVNNQAESLKTQLMKSYKAKIDAFYKNIVLSYIQENSDLSGEDINKIYNIFIEFFETKTPVDTITLFGNNRIQKDGAEEIKNYHRSKEKKFSDCLKLMKGTKRKIYNSLTEKLKEKESDIDKTLKSAKEDLKNEKFETGGEVIGSTVEQEVEQQVEQEQQQEVEQEQRSELRIDQDLNLEDTYANLSPEDKPRKETPINVRITDTSKNFAGFEKFESFSLSDCLDKSVAKIQGRSVNLLKKFGEILPKNFNFSRNFIEVIDGKHQFSISYRKPPIYFLLKIGAGGSHEMCLVSSEEKGTIEKNLDANVDNVFLCDIFGNCFSKNKNAPKEKVQDAINWIHFIYGNIEPLQSAAGSWIEENLKKPDSLPKGEHEKLCSEWLDAQARAKQEVDASAYNPAKPGYSWDEISKKINEIFAPKVSYAEEAKAYKARLEPPVEELVKVVSNDVKAATENLVDKTILTLNWFVRLWAKLIKSISVNLAFKFVSTYYVGHFVKNANAKQGRELFQNLSSQSKKVIASNLSKKDIQRLAENGDTNIDLLRRITSLDKNSSRIFAQIEKNKKNIAKSLNARKTHK